MSGTYSTHAAEFFFKKNNYFDGYAILAEDGFWLPYENGTSNKFLMFNLVNNSFATLLKCEPGAGLALHHHTAPVVGYCLQGRWKYKEYDWVAEPGAFVYEPAGDSHTLEILGDETMITLFHVMGPLIQLDESGKQVGFVDAFGLLENATSEFKARGWDLSYLEKITLHAASQPK
ncbi:MAG: 2,4'-dihydroxyacetophenone dioxygenase family protein [Cyanobacteriota bacterium]|nr:2,4'-dihydroxyacetophenone dioxygenase family protein [Cyanobacteriota bacterium]